MPLGGAPSGKPSLAQPALDTATAVDQVGGRRVGQTAVRHREMTIAGTHLAATSAKWQPVARGE